LNAKAYAMILKEEEALNQWLDEQLKTELIVKSKSRYAAPCFIFQRKMVHYNWSKTIGN